jgi:hypothetical protein
MTTTIIIIIAVLAGQWSGVNAEKKRAEKEKQQLEQVQKEEKKEEKLK